LLHSAHNDARDGHRRDGTSKLAPGSEAGATTAEGGDDTSATHVAPDLIRDPASLYAVRRTGTERARAPPDPANPPLVIVKSAATWQSIDRASPQPQPPRWAALSSHGLLHSAHNDEQVGKHRKLAPGSGPGVTLGGDGNRDARHAFALSYTERYRQSGRHEQHTDTPQRTRRSAEFSKSTPHVWKAVANLCPCIAICGKSHFSKLKGAVHVCAPYQRITATRPP